MIATIRVSRICLVLAFLSAKALSGPCGVEEKYLEAFGFLLYGTSEIAESRKVQVADVGPIAITWNLQCMAKGEELDHSDCWPGDCDKPCGATKLVKGAEKEAFSAANILIKERPNDVVAVGWVISASRSEVEPDFEGWLYVPKHKMVKLTVNKGVEKYSCHEKLGE